MSDYFLTYFAIQLTLNQVSGALQLLHVYLSAAQNSTKVAYGALLFLLDTNLDKGTDYEFSDNS
ncbi:hypothetical protein OLMES_0057 [Oleiphilus messinensis]|uniref:Uncharacterized protein n=1 Tax=Oleiphilus messinensis TaxID=141451 RepID=A0A1Y0I300_9GAMM|nr:hypothetical protein OLMES_0057 [Oleiphilus messinensis]